MQEAWLGQRPRGENILAGAALAPGDKRGWRPGLGWGPGVSRQKTLSGARRLVLPLRTQGAQRRHTARGLAASSGWGPSLGWVSETWRPRRLCWEKEASPTVGPGKPPNPWPSRGPSDTPAQRSLPAPLGTTGSLLSCGLPTRLGCWGWGCAQLGPGPAPPQATPAPTHHECSGASVLPAPPMLAIPAPEPRGEGAAIPALTVSSLLPTQEPRWCPPSGHHRRLCEPPGCTSTASAGGLLLEVWGPER